MRLLVLCGGRSAERDVSCVSASSVLNHLSRRYEPVLVRIDPEGRWWHQKDPWAFAAHPKPFSLPFGKVPARLELGGRPALIVGSRKTAVDAAFPVLHGPMGEDGTVQGLFEMAGLPYVGSGVLGSAVGMDKVLTKRLAAGAGLPILPYAVLEREEDLPAARELPLPVFVKPARLGSSVGVYKVKKASELAGAVRRAFRFDTTVIVEQGVAAREIECAVLGGGSLIEAAAAVGEIRPNAEFYSYEAKYLDPDGAKLIVPAEIPASLAAKARAAAVLAFRALGCHGLARADFLLDRESGALWFNELNTMPGFTAISMYPRLWAVSGLPFPGLIDRLVRLAVERGRAQSRLRITRD
jgi:D-alanine-D-alanine ligase